MKFTKAALHAILLLGLFQQAAADNAVIVTIGEMADNKVFMEWSGSLAVLPLTPVATSSPPSRQGIFSSTGRTYFNALPIGTAVPCKFCIDDFMVHAIAIKDQSLTVHILTILDSLLCRL